MENTGHVDAFIWAGIMVMSLIGLGIILFISLHRTKMLQKEASIRQMQIENQTRIHQMRIEYQLNIFKSASEAEDRQREKLGRNLHDSVLPKLGAVLRSIDQNVKDYGGSYFELERLKEDLNHIEELVVNIRDVSHELVPHTLISAGLIRAVADYVKQINSGAGFVAEFENNTALNTNNQFSMSEQWAIYKLLLEIINNLIKHAKFKYLKVVIDQVDGGFEFACIHNGVGITNEEIAALAENPKGVGLRSLEAGTMLLKGSLNYSDESERASVILTVPFPI